ncbi:MAG: DMT family transporter [Kiloniellales bacterium]
MVKSPGGLAFGMLLVSASVYGLVYPLNRLAGEAGATHFGQAFWPTLIGGLALALLAKLRGDVVSLRWPYLRLYLIVGATGFGLPLALITMISPHLPTALVSLCVALAPAFTYALSLLCRLDRFSLIGLAGIVLGFAGVIVVLAPKGMGLDESGLEGEEALYWFLLTLVIPLLFAITNLSAALLRPPNSSSLALGAGYLLGAAVFVLPLKILTGQSYLPLDTPRLGYSLALAAVLAVQILLFAELVQRYGPTFFAQFNYFVVVMAIAWGWVFFGETTAIYTWLALALMALGVLVSGRRVRATRQATPKALS